MVTDIDIVALRSFATAARAGSLTKAAQLLGTSQPAVSQQLRRLEDAVGAPLLARTTRGVTLTIEGHAALPYAERVVALLSDLSSIVAPSREPKKYRIGLLEHAAASGLAVILSDFAAVHDGTMLDIVIADSRALGAQLESGELDIALGDPAAIGRTSADLRRQAAFQLVWAVKDAAALTADPLPLVLFRSPCAWRDAVVDALGGQGIAWRAVLEGSNLATIQAGVQAGLGISALLPGTIQPGMLDLGTSPSGDRLPQAPSIELAIYRRKGLRPDHVSTRLEDIIWRSLR